MDSIDPNADTRELPCLDPAATRHPLEPATLRRHAKVMRKTAFEAGDICPDCERIGLPGALCPEHARASIVPPADTAALLEEAADAWEHALAVPVVEDSRWQIIDMAILRELDDLRRENARLRRESPGRQ